MNLRKWAVHDIKTRSLCYKICEVVLKIPPVLSLPLIACVEFFYPQYEYGSGNWSTFLSLSRRDKGHTDHFPFQLLRLPPFFLTPLPQGSIKRHRPLPPLTPEISRSRTDVSTPPLPDTDQVSSKVSMRRAHIVSVTVRDSLPRNISSSRMFR